MWRIAGRLQELDISARWSSFAVLQGPKESLVSILPGCSFCGLWGDVLSESVEASQSRGFCPRGFVAEWHKVNKVIQDDSTVKMVTGQSTGLENLVKHSEVFLLNSLTLSGLQLDSRWTPLDSSVLVSFLPCRLR